MEIWDLHCRSMFRSGAPVQAATAAADGCCSGTFADDFTKAGSRPAGHRRVSLPRSRRWVLPALLWSLLQVPIAPRLAGAADPGDDCNDNGTSDEEELATGAARDCNGNGVLDECDLSHLFDMPVSPVAFSAGEKITALAAGDFDGDGDLDLAAADDDLSEDSLRTCINGGDGTFEAPVSSPSLREVHLLRAADMDGDEDIDLVGGQLTLWRNDGKGAFPLCELIPWPVSGWPTRALVVSDVDRDGDIDMAMTAAEKGAWVYLNEGDGATFEKEGHTISQKADDIQAADIDGDADLDLLVTHFESTVTVLVNQGDGTFVAGPPISVDEPLGAEPALLRAGDLDGDGDVDIASGDPFEFRPGKAGIRILLNEGDGSFGLPSTVPLPSRPLGLLAADIEGDGDLDFAVTLEKQILLLLNRGDATFPPPTTLEIGEVATLLAAADLTGDGLPELVWVSEKSGQVVYLPNLSLPPSSRDANQDGVPDECDGLRFIRGDSDGSGTLDISDASHVFAYSLMGGEAPRCRNASDANDDGRIDISDGIFVLWFLFRDGSPPPPPGPACGLEPDLQGSPGDLGCASYEACQ